MPHHLVWMEPLWFQPLHSTQAHTPAYSSSLLSAAQEARRRSRLADHAAAQVALRALFAPEAFPSEYSPNDLLWQNDSLGKPYLTWQGDLAAWAQRQGRDSRHLHISNTHDGNAHLVLATYTPNLAGIGIDVVHLPRLRRPGKDRDYLYRFSRQFMSPAEWETFAAHATQDNDEALRLRVAAHFSLMESLSKACGTGLGLGIGLGRKTSLSRYSLGVHHLAPTVTFCFGQEALARLESLGVTRQEGYWGTDGEYLVSAALLWRK